jgi:hypothetical protein
MVPSYVDDLDARVATRSSTRFSALAFEHDATGLPG